MKILVFLLLFMATNLTLAADNLDTPEKRDQAVKMWNKHLESGENLTRQQLKEAILCFGLKMSDVYKEHGHDLSDADEMKYILPLEKSQFIASKKLINLPNEHIRLDEVTFHWNLCNNIEDYSQAYEMALTVLKKFGIPLDTLTEEQLDVLVNTYSHYENTPAQKIEELATFLKGQAQSPSALEKLADLYINRCMHQEIVAFCKPNLAELLAVTDEAFRERFQDTIPSFLFCKEYAAAQQIIQANATPTKSLFQSLIYAAMGKQEAAEISLGAYQKFITENPKGIDPEEIRAMPFLFKLLKKDVPGAVTVLESLSSRSKYSSSLLICLKEKGKYPEAEVQSLKTQYESTFLKPYSPYFLRHFTPIIELLLEGK